MVSTDVDENPLDPYVRDRAILVGAALIKAACPDTFGVLMKITICLQRAVSKVRRTNLWVDRRLE